MKKIIKKLVPMLIVASVATSSVGLLAGCGGNKEDASVTKIALIEKGYGRAFLDALVEEYNKTATTKAEIAESTSFMDYVETTLLSGPKANDVDLYFSIQGNNGAFGYISQGKASGYDCIFEDLSDVYNAVPAGYGEEGKAFKEMLNEYFVEASTYTDGKQYLIPWATGVEGLVYNTALFEKYNLSVPRTTNELFALCESMLKDGGNGQKVPKYKNAKNIDVYPYTFSGKVNYGMYLNTVWWAQFEGIDTFNNFLEGKDADGNLTPDIFAQEGRLSAYKNYHKLISKASGYTEVNANGNDFTTAQSAFLKEEALMIATGDWVEREMESSASNIKTIEFMPIPVNSDIINEGSALPDHSIKTDADLCAVIDYVNGDSQTLPEGVTDADVAFVASAMSMYMTEGDGHVMFVPSYANQKTGAKDFISFVLSKQGQEIMLQKGMGNRIPMDIDVSNMSAFASLSQFQKSKMDIMEGITYVGRKYNSPIAFNGGLSLWYSVDTNTCDSSFSMNTSSSSYKDALTYWKRECETMKSQWNNILQNAGIQ
jgi:ABC-type glycerol-3-phosphate transport system substrate-binding protein